MNTKGLCYPVGLQLTLPEDYKDNNEIKELFTVLDNVGISGVELNMAKPNLFDYNEVESFLKKFNLDYYIFASGLTAKTFGLSLSHEDEKIREASVGKIKEIIDFLENTGKGIVLGFFKGTDVANKQEKINQFKKSIKEIAPYAIEKSVSIIVEATNRYETPVANSLDDAVSIVKEINNPLIKILPDTYHMNIEEADMFGALKKYSKYYSSIHLSDNNRFFPGFGAIKFKEVIEFLKSINFNGYVALEGNIKNSIIEDITTSMKYLSPILKNN